MSSGIHFEYCREVNLQLNLHVDKAGASIQVFAHIESLVDVLGEDPAGQTVLRHVCSLHHPLDVTSVELAHYLVDIKYF